MAQMKAYTIPMKNWTQICLTIVFCRPEQVQLVVCEGLADHNPDMGGGV